MIFLKCSSSSFNSLLNLNLNLKISTNYLEEKRKYSLSGYNQDRLNCGICVGHQRIIKQLNELFS